MNDRVILVNKSDKRIGTAEKLEAHKKGLLHRAFSVFIFNDRGEMLLQKRASSKYHFAGLWSNACCSHPRPGERVLSAAKRRLREELGFAASLERKSTIIYKAYDPESGLTEHEYDHIFRGVFNGEMSFNRDEVEELRWASISELKRELKVSPEKFTPWFEMIFRNIEFD